MLRLSREKLGGWWRTTIFITMWPGMCYNGFLVPVSADGRKRFLIVLIKSLSAAIRIPIGLGLFAFGAWMGCPDSSWMLDHLLKLFEIYFFMGGAHDVIVALGWQTSFFMLHCLVAIAGLWANRHLIRRGIHIPRSLKIALTFVFIYFSSLLFMHCMDGLLIFHEGGVGTRLLNWGMGKWG